MHSVKSKATIRAAVKESEFQSETEIDSASAFQRFRESEIEKERVYDVDDHKISMVEEVGNDNVLRVTDDVKELEREWAQSELGEHDQLQMFLGAIGRVIDVEEDDDSVKLEWSNRDCHWLPVKACWIRW